MIDCWKIDFLDKIKDKIKSILVLLKEIFFDIMQLSYTTDGSGINHREYNRVKESTVWAKNSLDEWALFLVDR